MSRYNEGVNMMTKRKLNLFFSKTIVSVDFIVCFLTAIYKTKTTAGSVE